jgi:hypothetical protein
MTLWPAGSLAGRFTTGDKKEVLEAACNVYDGVKFMAASNDERVRMVEAKFGLSSAKSQEVMEVADEIEDLPQHPTLENGLKATADSVCTGMEAAKSGGR